MKTASYAYVRTIVRATHVTPMKILFVCLGNAFRSPVAEALLKKLKPQIEVDSAGVNPGIPIAEVAKKYLAKENAEEYLKKIPESLSEKNLASYDLIVVMEPRHKDIILSKCPECKNKIIVWDIMDPYFMPSGRAEEIFELVRQKVKALADSFK